ARLAGDVGAIEVAPGVPVREFIARMGAGAEFDKMLKQVQQIGGPRWLDDQTCQVKVELAGEDVFGLLIDLATRNPGKTPIPADQLVDQRERWQRRSFQATAESFTPEMSDAWRTVDESARQAAVDAARQNAVEQVLLTIKPVKFDDHTVAD